MRDAGPDVFVSPWQSRTVQDLLAERRANVQEMRREACPIARAMLQYHVDEIDRELARRR